MRITRLGVLAAAVAAIAIAPALAFHDDGVAHCNGCHTMHNSQNDVAMNFNAAGTGPGTDPGIGYADLLLFQNKTDVCLNCHAGTGGYHVWADDPLAPGPHSGAGNFVFQEEDNLNDGHAGGEIGCSDDLYDNPTDCTDNGETWGLLHAITGDAAGHTLASGIKGGTTTDAFLTEAPGGSYKSTGLTCVSCHDPHGNTSFRLTYQAGQVMTSAGNAPVVYTASIDATAISVFSPELPANHNAYRNNYGAWCGSCHGDFHNGAGALIHPAGEDGTNQLNGLADAYNLYNGTTDCIANPPAGIGLPCGSGAFANAYLAEVPFERGAGSLAGIGETEGPVGTDRVTCVTCHRAHGSSAPDAGRWDFNITGLAEDGHESGSYAIPNPYDAFQRSLCNKCHSKDEYDTAKDFTPAP